MELIITERAQTKINEMTNNKTKNVVLTYDTEGLGCGVNGLPTFQLNQDALTTYKKVHSNGIPTYAHVQQSVFFSEEMKLDYNGATFRLTSKEGILNPFISPMSIIHS